MRLLLTFTCLMLALQNAASDFSRVAKIFAEHCYDCHGVSEPDGGLILETHELLIKGGESGAAILPGNSGESLLVRMIEGKFEKDGKVRFMPPGKRDKLSAAEIDTIREWIDAGAKPPAETLTAQEIDFPKIAVQGAVRRPIHSMAYDTKSKLLAIGRLGEVEIVSAESQMLLKSFEGPSGNVNALTFSPDGAYLFAIGGDSGISGEMRQWKVADGTLVRTFKGHSDSIFAIALSPDGKLIATGSYDQKIKLWNAEDGKEIRTLSGHNGCVYGLSFRPDGRILASASGDRTVKLWDVASGERRDTLSQPLKEQYAVAFSRDGKTLAAGGVDRRIRIWEISEEARETTNPLLHSKFAHEGSILRIAFSPDGKAAVSSAEDKTVKLWATDQMQEQRLLESQSDWSPAVEFILDGKGVAVGRLDGTLAFYDSASGAVLRPPAPELTRVEPRGVQRGVTTTLKLFGKHLHALREVTFSNESLRGKILGDSTVEISSEATLPRGSYEMSVTGTNGSSGKVKLFVDDLPQLVEGTKIKTLPVAVWGTHDKSGERDTYPFEVAEKCTVVFDAVAREIGSKANLVLTLVDAEGKTLASSTGASATEDPLLAYDFPTPGRYQLTVTELLPAGSAEHFYKISIGSFPFVTGIFPPVVTKGQTNPVELLGFNLGDERTATLPLDPVKFRWHKEPKLQEVAFAVQVEQGTNTLRVPEIVSGRIARGEKADWYLFEAKAGQQLIIESRAASFGSPMDTKLEILTSSGEPITRTLLQAVRDSAVTFRGIDSTTVDCRVENWEEMELNQYLYFEGEVVRLFRAPQGPDSGFNFYAVNGSRRTYFDTTASAHANGEPCYIVRPHPPGATIVPNGLPVFPVYFENDDDSERKLGPDSKVYFTAPEDAFYFVRVTDTRGFSGDDFLYTVTIREAAPDFKISVDGMNPKIAKGSGQRFVLNVDRTDGFEGEIRVDVSGVPAGYSIATPIVIQEGHTSAFGTIYAHENATAAEQSELKLVATATVNGKELQRDAGSLGKISLIDQAPLYVALETETPEIVIAPGSLVPAKLKIRRNGHSELVTFQIENLPHGIIVDNIGLNGVLIPKDQNEREIFLTAARWVPETDRLCYAIANEAGRQTSRPVWVKVRKTAGQVATRQ